MQSLKTILRSKTSLNILVNTVGTYLAVAFSVGFTVLLTRLMGPIEYGVLAVLLSIVYAASNILDFGTTANIYARLPELHSARDAKRLTILVKSLLYYQSIGVCIVIVALLIAFPYLDRTFFKTGEPYTILALTAVSIYGFVIQNTLQNILYAMKEFVFVNIWTNVGNLVRFILALVLYVTGSVSIPSMLILLGLTAPLSLLLPIAWKYRHRISGLIDATPDRHEYRFRFAMTNFAAQQAFNLGMRMDLFILSSFGLKVAVGNYGLAQKIILSIISVVVSITQVLSPEFSTAKTKGEIRKVIRHATTYLLIPTVIFGALAITPDIIFHLVFTTRYDLTPTLARTLGLAYLMFGLGQIPMLLILYTIKKPIYLLASNLIFLVAIVSSCYSLIGTYGAIGAPIAIGISLTAVILVQTVMAYHLIKGK